ncbi:MAG: KpsF/GutQ family sugar-phosphate isomerase [Bacteroidaceae bacterium]|nr:KpsF/GutQ family sugar-phosphate isomerase [Bacteroidaceae bacterium]
MNQNIRSAAIKCLEIEAQAILGLIPQFDDNFERAIELIHRCKGKIVVSGVGKSGNVGAKIAATFSSTGVPAFYISPLDIYHGDLGVLTGDDVMLMISNSGQTDELLRFVPHLLERNIPIIAMTGNKDSLLAKYSTCHLNVSVEREACPLNLAPTSSTTAALAMGDALACALIELHNFKPTDFAMFHPGGSLGRRLLTTAKDVMHTENLPTIPPDMMLGEAIIHVSKGKLGIGIVEVDGKVEGLITDGDIRRAMEASKEKFFNTPVSSVMTHTPKMVKTTTKISQIQEIMSKNKIHSVLVVNDARELLGVVDHFGCMF